MLSAFVLFFVFSGCGEDEAKPEDFKTLEEAETALNGTQAELLFALDELVVIANLASSFDGNFPNDLVLLKNRKSHAFAKTYGPHSIGYNAQTGYWTFDTTITEGLMFSANGRIKFTPRDILSGLPNESTNAMEYAVTVTLNETAGENFFDLSYDADFDVIGIADYRDTTGNLTIDGSDKVNFSLDINAEGEHLVVDYDHSYKIKNVVLDPESIYPQSGTFEFTIKAEVSPSSYGEGFYVAGTITFDGTNIAVLEFGGYTFHLDLDTEIITPVV